MRRDLLRRVEPRFALATVLGLALVLMPLLILSYDPESKLERLRTPLCKGGLGVTATNQFGEPFLRTPDSGMVMNATVDGAPYPVTFTLFKRAPGGAWEYLWRLDAPDGGEIHYIPSVEPGFAVYARATDPTGERCPQDSPVLAAPPS